MQIHQEISKLIDTIQKHWQRSNSEDDRISRIDRDILINDLRKLYDLVYDLKSESAAGQSSASEYISQPAETHQPPKKNNSAAKSQDQKKESAASNEAVDETKESNPVMPAEPKQNPDEVVLEVTNDAENKAMETEAKAVEHEERENVEEEQQEHSEKMQQSQSTFLREEKTMAVRRTETRISASDKFEAPKTLADVYSKNGDNSLAAKIQKNAVADIKAAIGINDRFLFINTIFNGDADAYRDAIDFFNSTGSYSEALQFFEEIKHKYNLKDEPALGRLMEIVSRRF